MKRGCHAYQTVSTLGMSQLDLILVVYRGTIAYLSQAKEAFEQKNSESARLMCEKARTCLVHLYTTLNKEQGGLVAQNLGQLYAHMIERLDLAVAGSSVDTLAAIISLLNTIREGWEGLRVPESTNSDSAVVTAPPPDALVSADESQRLTVTA